MAKKKSTKKALLASVLALTLSSSMLVGTTFAWFTDSVTSSGNKIVAGTLKVDLELLDKNGSWNSIKESKAPIFNYDNWEPGYTDVKVLKVENEGTLALKWKAKFVSDEELSALANVIDVYVNPSESALTYPTDRTVIGADYKYAGTVAEFVNKIEQTTYGTLKADGETGDEAYLGIALKMQESAGNEYQGMSLGDFDIQIVATQLAYEGDSFGTDYDKDADYDGEISNATSLEAAFANGGTYKVVADITVEDTMTVPAGANVVLDLNGKTISGDIAKADGPIVKNNGTLVINGGTISSTATNGGSAIVNYGTLTVNDTVLNGAPIQDGGWPSYGLNNYGMLTINGAEINTYHGGVATGADGVTVINDADIDVGQGTETNQTSWAIYAFENGEVTVNGGTFANTKNEYGQVYGGGYICTSSTKNMTINGGTFDKTEGDNNGTGFYYNNQNLVIKGGTFDANPSTYVADGYVATKNADGTYTVVKGATVANVADLTNAIANGGNIVLTEDIAITNTLMTTKDVVIDLNGNTMTTPSSGAVFQSQSNASPDITITSSVPGAEINVSGGDTSVLLGYGSTVIKNVTINVTGCDNYSPNPFNVYGDLTLGEGTVVNVDYLGTALISNNGAVDIVIDGAEINIGTFKTNGTAIITLNQASTLEIKNTSIKIDNFVLSPFGGDSLVSKIDGVTVENCTFDVTDSNGASCTFVAKNEKYRLVQN